MWNVGTWSSDANGEIQVADPRGGSPEALHRGGITRSSEEVPEKRTERRGDVVEPNSTCQPAMGGTDEGGKATRGDDTSCDYYSGSRMS